MHIPLHLSSAALWVISHLISHLSSLISINLSSQQACRAVGGLLAYLQRTDVGSSMSIGKLERCRLDPC